MAESQKKNPLELAGFNRNLYRTEPAFPLFNPLPPQDSQDVSNPYLQRIHPSNIESGPIFGAVTMAGTFESTNYDSALKQGWQMTPGGLIEANGVRLRGVKYQDDSSITYTGTWSEQTVTVLIGGKRRVSSTVGDKFTITFVGDSIGLIMEQASDVGKFTVAIDGVTQGTVDLYNTALFSRQVVYTKSGLKPGRHVLVGTVATKNASSSANTVGLQAYVLNPSTSGIGLDFISADLYVTSFSTATDGDGYAKSTNTNTPTGYFMWGIMGFYLSEAVMAAGTDDPKLAHGTNVFYFYNGAASTTYANNRVLLISKKIA